MDERLTKRQFEILEKLNREGREFKAHTVEMDQGEISEEFGITRQALSNHLRELKEKEFIRTGRGFIDLTERGRKILGKKEGEVLIMVEVEPNKRSEAYEKLADLSGSTFRTTGQSDVIVKIERDDLESTLNRISRIGGVKETSSHVILKKLE